MIEDIDTIEVMQYDVTFHLPSNWLPWPSQVEAIRKLEGVRMVCFDHASWVAFWWDKRPTEKQVKAKLNIIKRIIEKQMSAQKKNPERWE